MRSNTVFAFASAAIVAAAFLGTVSASDVGKSMVELVEERGYPVEEHFVETADGYILGAFRIPYGRPGTKGGSNHPGKPVAFLQHGLLDSSYAWVCNFQNESLAYVLADAGYDVWMGNSRGNVFSMRHKTLDPSSTAFWQFTWDEMAKYDLPANIDYVLSATGKSTLSYIGHSQGTIQAFAGFSTNQTLADKVNVFAALAPVAYVDHQKSLLLTAMADLDVVLLFELLGDKDFLPDDSILQKLVPGLCKILPSGCDIFLELLCGPSHNLNKTRIDVYVSETPAGTSVMNMAHWAQGVKTDAFQMYDYGCGLFSCENEKHYGQKTPPLYHLDQLKLPIGLFSGSDDWLADPEDVQRIIDEVPKSSIVYADQISGYAHLDFTWGENAHPKVYSNVFNLMQRYNPV